MKSKVSKERVGENHLHWKETSDYQKLRKGYRLAVCHYITDLYEIKITKVRWETNNGHQLSARMLVRVISTISTNSIELSFTVLVATSKEEVSRGSNMTVNANPDFL